MPGEKSPHPPAPWLSQQLIYLPPPWGTCKAVTMDSDFFDSYSITACRIDCETRYLVENCNCRMVHMPGQAPKLQTQSWGPSAHTAPHQLPMLINLLPTWKQDQLASPHPVPAPLHTPVSDLISYLYPEGWVGRVQEEWAVGWVASRTDWGLASPTVSFSFSFQLLDLCKNHCPKSPLISILHHCLFSSVGDAPYCTPEQYKECADPALGERPCLGGGEAGLPAICTGVSDQAPRNFK